MRTIDQVAELFGVTRSTVKKWVHSYKHLKASERFGKSLAFTNDDLRAFVGIRTKWFEDKAGKFVVAAERLESDGKGRAVGRMLANAQRMWGRADAMREVLEVLSDDNRQAM